MHMAVAYEYGRVLVSTVGLCGAAMVLWEALRLCRVLQTHGSPLLREVQQDHAVRALGLMLLNLALWASAIASTGLTAPDGATWREWLRIGAILFISCFAAVAPWWERWRRDRLRARVGSRQQDRG